MTKYKITFHVDVSAADPRQAFIEASDRVGQLPAPPLPALAVMPTGGATGEPRTEAGPGWMVVFSVEEAD